jgi:hypothetical protein
MEGSALAPPHQVAQKRFMIAAMLLGAAGSLIGLAGFSSHDYRVGALVMKMEVRPETSGTTELAVEPVRTLQTGFAEAETHMGFLAVRGTVIGIIGEASLLDAVEITKDPLALAEYVKEQGKDAARRFLLRTGLITIGGGGAGGLVIALFGMKARRILQGAAAGLIVVGVLGLVAWQTYDIEKFEQTQFRPGAAPLQGG